MGVPDYVPSEAVVGPVTVMPTAFGKLSEGRRNVSRVKTGRITLCRLAYTGDRYRLHLAVGVSRPSPSWEEAGWELPAPQLPSLDISCWTPRWNHSSEMSLASIISWPTATIGGPRLDLCHLWDVDVIE